MATRRTFVAGLLAAGAAPQATWADAGGAEFLSAARLPNGSYALCGLRRDGSLAFTQPLPGRGHAAAAHPINAQAIAFARRPGTFALALDCSTGRVLARLNAPEGRHFYGHGTFSADGTRLFTTENDYQNAQGVIGVWDAANGYARLAEFPSGGIGPHDIALMPDGATLVVANGGIETHPETGRAKLNLPSMRSNLTYLALDGTMQDQLELAPAHQRNSIRHLAVSRQGTVAFGMQWQGDLTADLPLVGLHHRGAGTLRLLKTASVRDMQGYVGSIAINDSAQTVAATSPRRGVLQILGADGTARAARLDDVCGVAAIGAGFLATTGQGVVHRDGTSSKQHHLSWDNHLVQI